MGGHQYLSVGGAAPIPLNYPVAMFEYGWITGSLGNANVAPGYSTGYYVGIPFMYYCGTAGLDAGFIQNSYIVLINFSETNGGDVCSSSISSSYYYAGSGWSGGVHWNIYLGQTIIMQLVAIISRSPPFDQQNNKNYMYYGVFYTYYWFSPRSK